MLARVGAIAALSGCSFAIAVTDGSDSVRRKHEYVDAGLTAVTGVACVLAAVAWVSPDAYGSNASRQELLNVQATGVAWTPFVCTAAALTIASGIYGHVVRSDSDDDGPYDPSLAVGISAFANGFLNAGKAPEVAPVSPVRPTLVPRVCTSDFGCGIGFRCVKQYYQTAGVCLRAVDSDNVQIFDEPNPNSIGPSMPQATDCELDSDCAAGFRCDVRSGICVR